MRTSYAQRVLDQAWTALQATKTEDFVLRRPSGAYWHCSAGREVSREAARDLCLGEKKLRYVDIKALFRTEDGDSYKPHAYQLEPLCASEQFIAFCAGLGTGKTSVGAVFSVETLLLNPGGTMIIGAPWNRTLKQSTLPMLDAVLPAWLVRPPRHRSDAARHARKDDAGFYEFRLVNGSRAVALTMEEKSRAYDAISGINAVGYWLDEGAFCSVKVHQRLVQRMRKASAPVRRGIITTTPPVHLGWMYDVFETTKPELRHKFRRFRASTRQATHLPPDYLPNLLDTLSEVEISIMVDGNFEVASGVVYAKEVSLDIEKDSWLDWKYDPSRPVYLGVDYGFRKSAAVWYQPSSPDGEDLVLFDELIAEDLAVDAFGVRVRERGYHITQCMVGPDLSDEQVETLRRHLGLGPYQVVRLPRGYRQEVRVECFRQRLLNARGEKHLRFARHLHGRSYSQGIDGIWRALRRYAYPETIDGRRTRNVPKDDGISSHVMSAAQYPITKLFEDRRRPAEFR
jgi:hypothetical protein